MISSSTANNVPSSSSSIINNNNSELDDPIIVDYVSDISDSEDNLHQNINTNQSTFINEINDSDTTITANTNTTTSLDNNNNIIIENSSPPTTTVPLSLSSTIETLKSSSNNNSSSSTKQESSNNNQHQHEDENSEDNMWSCNICFDTASEPVITQCGHLYCWSCIYRWMQSHSTQNLQCPVCKAGIQQDKLIPIYGRGHSHSNNSNNSNSNGSSTNNNNDNIPQRPRGQYTDSRTTPNPNYNPFHNMTNLFGNFNTNNNVMGGGFHSTNQFLFSDAFRFFPFFDLGGSSNNSTTGNNNRNHPLVPPPTEQEELQGFVRRLALFLGFILLFYIIFI